MIRSVIGFFCSFLLLPVSAEESAENQRVEQVIGACVEMLQEVGSTNVEKGRLKVSWSTIWVNRVSIEDYAMVLIGRKITDHLTTDPNFISDASQISCLVSSSGGIKRLTSPEEVDDSVKTVDLVVADEEFEKRIFDNLVYTVRAGIDVYTIDTFFEITNGEIEKIGENRVEKINPNQYKSD